MTKRLRQDSKLKDEAASVPLFSTAGSVSLTEFKASIKTAKA